MRRRARGAALLALAFWCAPAALRAELPRSSEKPRAIRCSHAMSPIAPALRREYQVTPADPATAPFQYTQTYDAVDDPDRFAETLVFSNGSRRVVRMRCDEKGGLLQEAAEISGATAMAGARLGTVSRAPLELPPKEKWKVGERWSETIDVSGRDLPGVPKLGDGAAPSVSGTLTSVHEIVAQEKVTVPAGTYDAFKVETLSAQKLTVAIGGLGSMPVDLAFKTTTWYVAGVGMVKTVAETFGLTTELISSAR